MTAYQPPPPPSFVAALAATTVTSSLEDATKCSSPDGKAAPKIGTHDGSFHADEALGCAMLKMLPAYEDAVVVRSRNPAVLEGCDVVIDVGAKYEPERHRYDHHQREFSGVMEELGHKTKLSSAGLVYRHFGRDVVSRLIGASGAATCGTASDCESAIYRKTYKGFLEHIDGIDNGLEAFEGGTRSYEVTTTLSSRVGRLNPRWNEPQGSDVSNLRFAAAMALAGAELAAAVEGYANSWWPARSIVAAALDAAAAVHSSRQVVVLQQYCPWASHIFELEQERADAGDAGIAGAAKYVLFPDSTGNGEWRVQAVAVEEGSFESRRKLPQEWRGLRGAELSAKAGIEGCVFCHAGGFIGGASNFEGAKEMALKAIET